MHGHHHHDGHQPIIESTKWKDQNAFKLFEIV